MSVTEFEATEVVSRVNVNQRINQINAYFPVSFANGGTGATSAVGARTNLEIPKGYTLYSNSSGTNNTIPITDLTNYDYMDIYYQTSSGETCVARGKCVAGEKIALSETHCTISGSYTNFYFNAILATVSANSITFGDKGLFYFESGTAGSRAASIGLLVTRVVGYKY